MWFKKKPSIEFIEADITMPKEGELGILVIEGADQKSVKEFGDKIRERLKKETGNRIIVVNQKIDYKLIKDVRDDESRKNNGVSGQE